MVTGSTKLQYREAMNLFSNLFLNRICARINVLLPLQGRLVFVCVRVCGCIHIAAAAEEEEAEEAAILKCNYD